MWGIWLLRGVRFHELALVCQWAEFAKTRRLQGVGLIAGAQGTGWQWAGGYGQARSVWSRGSSRAPCLRGGSVYVDCQALRDGAARRGSGFSGRAFGGEQWEGLSLRRGALGREA